MGAVRCQKLRSVVGLSLVGLAVYLVDKKTGLITDYVKSISKSKSVAGGAGVESWFMGSSEGMESWFVQSEIGGKKIGGGIVGDVKKVSEVIADSIRESVKPVIDVGSSVVKPLSYETRGDYDIPWLAPSKLSPENTPVAIIREIMDEPIKAVTKVIKQPVKVITQAVKAVDSVVADIGSEDRLLELIARGEGTTDSQAHRQGYSNGYEVTLAYGKYEDDKTRRITSMTLGELKAHQGRMLASPKNLYNSSAAGKYQIVRKTLIGLQSQMGLDDSVMFSPTIQDKMAVRLLNGRGYQKFKAGTLSALDFQYNLSKEWASIEDPRNGYGKSYYPRGKVASARDPSHTKTTEMSAVLNSFA